MVANALLLNSPDNSGAVLARFDAKSFQSEVSRIALDYGPTTAGPQRARLSQNRIRFDSLVQEFRRQWPTARRVDSHSPGAAQARRFDAFDASAALFQAQQLEHRYAEVLREPAPMNNALSLFPIDSSVSPGARTHTVSRLYTDGEVKVHRAGMDVPRVGLSQQEQTFQVRHYVTSFVYDLFEALSAGFANFALVSELLRTARDVTNEFLNAMTWYGSADDGIYGVLTYPWLAKTISAVEMHAATASTSTQIIAELNRILNYPQENSKSTMRPNTVVMSPRLRNYIMGTPRSTTTDTSIGKWWLDNFASGKGITSIEEAQELQGVGPGGTDGILFYRRDRLGISNVIVQPFTTLPVQSQGFDNVTLCYMSHGGVIMRNVGGSILAWVVATA